MPHPQISPPSWTSGSRSIVRLSIWLWRRSLSPPPRSLFRFDFGQSKKNSSAVSAGCNWACFARSESRSLAGRNFIFSSLLSPLFPECRFTFYRRFARLTLFLSFCANLFGTRTVDSLSFRTNTSALDGPRLSQRALARLNNPFFLKTGFLFGYRAWNKRDVSYAWLPY